MGRWTDMDSDAGRLPSGFERLGYDADTQTYTFRDADGNLYESEPGNRYGELRATGQRYSFDSEAEAEAQSMQQVRHELMENGNTEAVRMMMPFALIVLVFLILVFTVVVR
ncbi:peptidoglycan-binding domain [Pyrenophora seminiperda CCB06]|uniref:Peptidoglycan-binding domain n=1 Tax=Pyrenophora seminiperda CCB06 TaxID=1302712 RepID=A0A3M7LWD8_9PLEO|nr:peptidoglycan-binding domain [Pyrenophora seminiperda CCB06]